MKRIGSIILFLLSISPLFNSGCDDPVTPPAYIRVKINAPRNGAALAQSPVSITATTEASCGCQQYVEFKINGVLAYTDYATPYEFSWDFAGLKGAYVLRVDATLTGKATGSDSISVRVNE